MRKATRGRRLAASVIRNSALSGVVCAVVLFAASARGQPFGAVAFQALISFGTGFCTPALIIILEGTLFKSRAFLRLPFLAAFPLKVAAYLLVGLAVYIAVGLVLYPDQVFTPGSVLLALLFTAVLSLLFNVAGFLRQFLGKLFFRTYLTSVYHRAKEVRSIFLFIDVAGSTSLGERLKPAAFFRLLNEFIYAVEQAIDLHDGLIYKYVGDCIIALWDAAPRGFLRAWDAVLEIQRAVADAQPRFREISGADLGFTLGVHCGPVIVGEIGQERREIGYLGDTINTTQRVQSACKPLKTSILLSDAFVAGVTSAVTGGSADAPHPAGLVRHEGVRVAGKEEPLVLHALG